MKQETSGKIMYGILGLVCGGIIAMIIGFNWGGWTTSGTTKTMTEDAVLASKAAICIVQFIKDPNYKEKLKEFEKIDSYGMNNRSDYVQKQGWSTMPGEKEPDSRVAYESARRIMALEK